MYVKSGGQTIYTMIASTGVDDATPHGSYTIDTRGEHFYNAEEGMGADYWVQFYGSYLFHSVPTGEAFGDYLPEEGAKLGQPASHGCVRLAVATRNGSMTRCRTARWSPSRRVVSPSVSLRSTAPSSEGAYQRELS